MTQLKIINNIHFYKLQDYLFDEHMSLLREKIFESNEFSSPVIMGRPDLTIGQPTQSCWPTMNFMKT